MSANGHFTIIAVVSSIERPYTAQESLVLFGNKISTFVLSLKAFNISEKSLA